ncbi:MAG: ribosomal protein L7/L12 [Phycisphaeraceae bacterium]|nr:ribosomal protein L7/L12 [Phycisphaeraceae bacterium]MCB9848006.1 ribosomal protein L7/L12 [Phycisphaeraceae bacterium]
MNVDNDVLDLLSNGQELDALELHRERTGVGHEEAVAHIQAAKQISHNMPGNDPAIPEIDALLHARKKIEAIKVARQAYSIGLKEAKDLVEERQYVLGLRTPGSSFNLFGFLKKSK